MRVREASLGARYSSSNTWRGPLVAFPDLTSADVITASVRWARTFNDSTPTTDGQSGDVTIQFTPSVGGTTVTLVGVPPTNALTSTSWTTAVGSAIAPSSLSSKQGWIEVKKGLGSTDHTVGVDDITVYLNGQRLLGGDYNAEQSAGKCPCNLAGMIHSILGDPVNTYSGSFYVQGTDLPVGSGGPSLTFGRSYTGMLSDPTRYASGPLGPGWHHSFEHTLIFPTQTGGISNTVIYEVPTGNRLYFHDPGGNGPLAPAQGVRATLVRAGGTYTLTARDQTVLLFDAQGRLTEQRDPQGHRQTLSYYTSTGQVWEGRLQRVTDVATGRTLTLTYRAVGSTPRLKTVQDAMGRTVSYTSTAAGDLETVTDLRGGVTTYGYAGTTHLLTTITDPLLVVQLTNQFDGQRRVQQQTDATGIVTTYQYATTPTGPATTVTLQRPGGTPEVLVDHYRLDGSLEYQEHSGQLTNFLTYDASATPSTVVDGRGTGTKLQNNAVGLPLRVTNAVGQVTSLTYRADNRPSQITTPDQVATTMTYDGVGNRTKGQQVGGSLQLTAIYTYTADNRVQDQRAPDGVVTRQVYDGKGQVTQVVQGFGTAQAQTTQYGYDAVGRVVTTTLGLGTATQQINVTRYNSDSTVAVSIRNYQDGVFTPTQPDVDVPITYGYDPLGRPLWTRDALGRYTVTHYDAAGRIDWTARNLTSYTGGTLPTTPPTYSAAQPDANVATFYGYDALSRMSLITDTGILTGTFNPTTLQWSGTTTRVTRTEYDTLSRPVTTTLNYRLGLPIDTLPDVNVQTLTYYDGAGNVNWQRDAIGRWAYTEYDALSRPVTTTLNYENGDPNTVAPDHQSWTDGSDSDLITVTRYDTAGRLDRTIDNYVDGTFVATEPITDRAMLYQYDTLSRLTTRTDNYVSNASGNALNRKTTLRYEAGTGRLIGQQDPLTRWVSLQYDVLGRVQTTVQNCQGGTVPATCSAYSASYKDRNIAMRTIYDGQGRAAQTIANYVDGTFTAARTDEDVTTQTLYDGVGRVRSVVNNFVSGKPTDAQTNVATTATYNALGQAIKTTDATNAAVQTQYDRLGSTSVITDAVGRVTRVGYDGSGTLRWSKRGDGQITTAAIDGLGRMVRTVVNVVAGGTAVDQNVTNTVSYDAAGRRVQTIDTINRVTQYAYDGRDLLTSVRQNVLSVCAPERTDCNTTTRYGYDRAGRQISVLDARGLITRRLTYNAADELTRAADALGRTTVYTYDQGGRITQQGDPRGQAYGLSFAYDGLDRRTNVNANNTANLKSITQGYDAFGRRIRLQDAASGTTLFGVDALGHTTIVTDTFNGRIRYGYSARGERTTLTYPSGLAVGYNYLPDGTLDTVTQGSTTLADYGYDAVGRMQNVVRANGTTTSYAYDKVDHLRDISTTAGSTPINHFVYQLDQLGRRQVVTETLALASGSNLRANSTAAPTQAQTLSANDPASTAAPASATATPSLTRTKQLPLLFVANQGQTDASVRYQAYGTRGSVFFTSQEAVIAIPLPTDVLTGTPQARRQAVAARASGSAKSAATTVRLQFEGANTAPDVQPLQRTTSVVNVYTGADKTRWRANLATTAGVVYRNLYTGIDLQYTGTDGQLKRTYVVAPGADVRQIRWRYTGAQRVSRSADGSLTVQLPASKVANTRVSTSTLVERAPIAWQDIAGKRVPVNVQFNVAADGRVTFSVGAYDQTQPLTIDPVLDYGSYVGGSAFDVGAALAMDSAGRTYITGWTNSSDFPQVGTSAPATTSNKIVVGRLNASGTAWDYLTYVGGNDNDQGHNIAVGSNGVVYVTGYTGSSDLATLFGTSGYQPSMGAVNVYGDAFVARLDGATGMVTGGTYLGGSGGDETWGMALDGTNNVYVTGETTSADFPHDPSEGECTNCSAGQTDAFVVKLSADLATRVYTRFLGTSGGRYAWAIAVDSAGTAIAVGQQGTTNGVQGFATRLDPSGAVVWDVPFYGTNGNDVIWNVALDASGFIYVVGQTAGGLPVTSGSYQAAYGGGALDTFVGKLAPDLSGWLYLNYLGGSGNDMGYGIAVDPSTGIATVVGETGSANFPVKRPIQSALWGAQDSFVAQLSADGSQLTYSTFLGGSDNDAAYGVALDANGTANLTGYTTSGDTPTANPQQSTYGGTGDAFVARISDSVVAPAAPSQRVIRYAYDGLDRLTNAAESPGTTYAYTYDVVGNRLEARANGTLVERQQYDAANQVVGWQYDAAGNLLNDRTNQYTYDSLNRISTSNALGNTTTTTYNGDGTLVKQVAGTTTTTYTQDLAASLSQVLARGRTQYVYGQERLYDLTTGTKTWYAADALGSVRQTLTTSGAVQSTVFYDPWGQVETGTVPTFGFAGELQNAATGLVNLRARWYAPQHGTFTSVDPFLGHMQHPYSLHPYAYAWSNPVTLSDPSGRDPWWYDDPHPGLPARAASGQVATNERDRHCHAYDYYETRNGRTPGRCDANVVFDYPHESLAVLSFVPEVGAVAMMVDAGVYCAEGDYLNALLASTGFQRYLAEIRGMALLSKNIGKRIKRLTADLGDNWWLNKDAVEVDPTTLPPSRYSILKQPNTETCMATACRMAGAPDDAVAALERLATERAGSSNRGVGLNEARQELSKYGWRVDVTTVSNRQGLSTIERELNAGKAVILNIPTDAGYGHAVLVRSIEHTPQGANIIIHDPSTGKVWKLDEGYAWLLTTQADDVQFGTLSR